MGTSFYKQFGKRLLDVMASGVAVLLLSPIILVIAVLLYIVNRGSPFFVQRRPGLGEKEFRLIKFKTMTDDVDSDGRLLPNHLRTTRVGGLLRRFSLDELPQLFNVLLGDMSLVGPRPLLARYIPLYSPEQRRRHLVRPGITGWAQVNGRNAITWTRKFDLDLYYVENISLVLDLKILFLTLLKVVRAQGVNASEKMTMEPFNGCN